MVRSIFEHCPTVWRPSAYTTTNKLETIQKRAIKWINQDYSVCYSSNDLLYYVHCKQPKILPVRYRFDYHDLKLFHLIVHKISCIKLPYYLHFYEGSSILRSTHLDHLSIVSTVPTTRRGFTHTYFYRTHLLWNRIPLSIREIIRPSEFKIKIVELIWKELVVSEYNSDNES